MLGPLLFVYKGFLVIFLKYYSSKKKSKEKKSFWLIFATRIRIREDKMMQISPDLDPDPPHRLSPVLGFDYWNNG